MPLGAGYYAEVLGESVERAASSGDFGSLRLTLLVFSPCRLRRLARLPLPFSRAVCYRWGPWLVS
jgi:hypothetical protein